MDGADSRPTRQLHRANYRWSLLGRCPDQHAADGHTRAGGGRRAQARLSSSSNYGRGQPDAANHLGRPGDEGLDGVINEDSLGLDKIYVQAKRYSDQVGQEKVRSFAGSLDGAHATKGVMITTSTFSAEAYRWVDKIEKRLVLIDGALLARYMVDHEVGVQLRTQLRLYRVDEDFFEGAV